MSPSTPWIFGYGSLVFRPDFPFAERRPAWISGWVRRFWQSSPDHRGTPDAPGRVATLVPEPGGRCAGVAYRIPDDRLPEVLAHLDHREIAGYERLELPLHLPDRTVAGLCWRAGPANPGWLGPADPEEMVTQIATRAGRSGANRDYLVRLAEALRELDEEDPHVTELLARLRAREER